MRPPTSTLFPYTTLFRSADVHDFVVQKLVQRGHVLGEEALVLADGVPAQRRRAGVAMALHELQRFPLRLRHAEVRRSEEHTSELQSQSNLVCRLLLEKNK